MKNKKMTRVQAERALQSGSLDPQKVFHPETGMDDFPNYHVRYRAFKMLDLQASPEEGIKKISPEKYERLEKYFQRHMGALAALFRMAKE